SPEISAPDRDRARSRARKFPDRYVVTDSLEQLLRFFSVLVCRYFLPLLLGCTSLGSSRFRKSFGKYGAGLGSLGPRGSVTSGVTSMTSSVLFLLSVLLLNRDPRIGMLLITG